MGVKDIIQKSLLEGYATSNITVVTVLVCMLCTLAISLYIYYVYKYVNRNAFYNKSFHLSLILMAIVTAAIILTIQSNIVVSLGMVGALSIIRFRTAIKDPIDLGFLFWAISAGIICGAGFALIAVIASVVITFVIVGILLPTAVKRPLVLVINATSYTCEPEIMEVVRKNCAIHHVKARNVSRENLNLVIEISEEHQYALIEQLMLIPNITNASVVEHNGDITV